VVFTVEAAVEPAAAAADAFVVIKSAVAGAGVRTVGSHGSVPLSLPLSLYPSLATGITAHPGMVGISSVKVAAVAVEPTAAVVVGAVIMIKATPAAAAVGRRSRGASTIVQCTRPPVDKRGHDLWLTGYMQTFYDKVRETT
jgi:hypothetical protein